MNDEHINLRENKPVLRLSERETIPGRVVRMLALLAFTCAMGWIIYLFCKDRLENWELREYFMAVAGAALVLGAGAIFWALRERVSAGWLLAAVLTLCAAIRLGFILVIPTAPVSDFEELYRAALASAQGDFQWSHVDSGYFYSWAYQIPFVLYEATVLRVIPSIFALKLLNVVWMTGAAYLVYRISRRVMPEWAALYGAFLYSVYPGTVLLASVLTNQHIAMFFLLLGIELTVGKKKWWRQLLGGVSLGVGNLMRPEGIIVVLAILCCGVLFFIENPGKKNAAAVTGMIAVLLLGYFGIQKMTAVVLYGLDIAPNGIGNNCPQWKFLLGLDTTTAYGNYSDHDYSAYISYDSNRWQLLLDYIRQRFSGCSDLPKFFRNKVSAFWTLPESFSWPMFAMESTDVVLPGLTVEGFQRIVGCMQRGMLLVMYILALPAAAALWKRNADGRMEDLLMGVILCGIFCVFLAVEVQVRYRYVAVPFLCMVDAVTMGWLLQRRKK